MTSAPADSRLRLDTKEPERVTWDLRVLLDEKLRLVAAMHTYKFACIESGDRDAFELIEALQHREAREIDCLRRTMRGRLCH